MHTMSPSNMLESLAIRRRIGRPLWRNQFRLGRRITKKALVEPKKGLFYSYFYLKGLHQRHSSGLRRVAIGPHVPSRPYLHWKVARLCGFRFTGASDGSASLAIRFDDATWSTQGNETL